MKEANKYVLIIQFGAQVLFAVSDSPSGSFKYQHRKELTDWIGASNKGDQMVFSDEDTGKSHLVYSFGRGSIKYISEIGVKNDTLMLLDYKQVYIGFFADGKGVAFAMVNDVVLVKEEIKIV